MSLTFPELIEQCKSLPSGGYITKDSRLKPGQMASIINGGRAYVVRERWKQYGKVPPIYYQKFYPQYDKLAQDEDSCYAKFYGVPNIIALDGRATGLGYIGSSNSLNLFREVSSKAAMASMLNQRVIGMKRKGLALIGGSGEIDIYWNTKIKLPELQAVFSDPRQVPLYNYDFDPYPMDIGDIPMMEQFLMNGGPLRYMAATPIDRINDGRDTTAPPPVKANT